MVQSSCAASNVSFSQSNVVDECAYNRQHVHNTSQIEPFVVLVDR